MKKSNLVIIGVLILALAGGLIYLGSRKTAPVIHEKPATGVPTTTPEDQSEPSHQTEVQNLSPEGVIKKDIEAQNNHDWDTFLSLLTTKMAPENRDNWIQLRETGASTIMEKVVSATLVGIKPIPYELARPSFKEFYIVDSMVRPRYNEDEIKGYYVAIDYQVKNPDSFVQNGVNYRTYILLKENDGWKIAQVSEAVVPDLIKAGYGFDAQALK